MTRRGCQRRTIGEPQLNGEPTFHPWNLDAPTKASLPGQKLVGWLSSPLWWSNQATFKQPYDLGILKQPNDHLIHSYPLLKATLSTIDQSPSITTDPTLEIPYSPIPVFDRAADDTVDDDHVMLHRFLKASLMIFAHQMFIGKASLLVIQCPDQLPNSSSDNYHHYPGFTTTLGRLFA